MKVYLDSVHQQVVVTLEIPKEFEYFRQVIVGQFKPSAEVDKFANELNRELTVGLFTSLLQKKLGGSKK